jgi:hypothetical protein
MLSYTFVEKFLGPHAAPFPHTVSIFCVKLNAQQEGNRNEGKGRRGVPISFGSNERKMIGKQL